MPDLLSIRDLTVEFDVSGGVVRAVDGVSFRIPPDSTVALVGESGSGKSVISQTIMGILPRSARISGGEILLDDPGTEGPPVDLTKLDPDGKPMRAIRGGRISIIFQEPMTSLSPLHTVGDQVSEALLLHREVTRPEAEELTRDMLRMVGFPDPARALRTYPFELSGGLRQRAMIAMALVCRPALLIADEPTTALDVTIQAQTLKLIRDLQQELGMAVLMITHDLGVVANVADEVVVMYHGRIMERGALEDIFENPGHDYLKGLFRAVPRFHMAPGERLTPLREISHTTGHLMAARGGADPKPGRLLQIDGLSKSFTLRKGALFGKSGDSTILAVDDVSLYVNRGECLGLVGESGCGKTTLSKLIMRALSPDSGQVLFESGDGPVNLVALGERELLPYRQKMQFIFQDPFGSLNPRMTVYDIICEPLIIHDVGDAEYRTEMVRELMALVGLDPRHLNRYPHSFSGGQRQRIGIARALALKPEILICDEPVSALDVSIQAQILNLLKDLQSELGLTYIFISHNLAVVDYIADRIAVMCAGRIVETAAREELFRNPVHPYTKALLAAVPEPNIRARLDLSALMEGRASDPTAWPPPFRIEAGAHLPMVSLSESHSVRAEESISRPEPTS